jgi:hypothetical protein
MKTSLTMVKRCEHNRRRSQCKDCGGASICEHMRQRNRCKDCKVPSERARAREEESERERAKCFMLAARAGIVSPVLSLKACA